MTKKPLYCAGLLAMVLSFEACAYNWQAFNDVEGIHFDIAPETIQFDPALKESRVWVRQIYQKIQHPDKQSPFNEIQAQLYYDCDDHLHSQIQAKYYLDGKLVRTENNPNYFLDSEEMDDFSISGLISTRVCRLQ